MQEAVACCLKQYPLLNPDRSKNASMAFGKVAAYLERKRKNIRSKSTQKGKKVNSAVIRDAVQTL